MRLLTLGSNTGQGWPSPRDLAKDNPRNDVRRMDHMARWRPATHDFSEASLG